MAENYVVNYDIKVSSSEAVTAIKQFQTAVSGLSSASVTLNEFNKVITATVSKLAELSKVQKIEINTEKVEQRLDSVIRKVRELQKSVQEGATLNVKVKDSVSNVEKATSSKKKRETATKAENTTKSATPESAVNNGVRNLKGLDKETSATIARIDELFKMRELKIDEMTGYLREIQSMKRELESFEIQASDGGGSETKRGLLDWLTGGKNKNKKKKEKNSKTIATTSTTDASLTDDSGKEIKPPKPTQSNKGGGKRKSNKKKTGDNLGYKLFGPTPLPNGGGIATDILQGFGVAYGMSAIGQLTSEIVNQSSAYDNTMQTVENILKSHDSKGNFNSRFANMSNTVRNVGVETKFTVSEVADAAKFLAMAGIDLDAIQSSIRPIADIALVGDTDLATTADLMTNVMTAYNINADKMRDTADIMTNTFTMTNTTLPEIAESYKYAASLLSTAGVEFESATAAIGVLGDAGIKGSQAGTTLRTIMANIANPTQKQSAAWKSIGVSTVDANGNQKTLLEIFQELNKKNLGVADYYKIFNKTAASGAAALANHADKWESVYLENLKSQGLSGELAEKKKNTVQGLWAQVESSFVNTGMTVFQEKQGTIQAWMKEAIAWLQSDDALEKFRKFGDGVMEFVQMLVEAVKWVGTFADKMGPFILTFAKFQLVVAPVVGAIKAFKVAYLGLEGLGKVGQGVLKFLKILNGEAVEATKAVETLAATEQAAENGGGSGSTGNGGNGRRSQSQGGFRGRIGELWGRYNKQVVGTGFGALTAYASMEALTRENSNGWDLVSGGAYGLAAMLAMNGALPLAAGAALGGMAADTFAWAHRISEAANEMANFAEVHQIVNNVMMDSNDITERSLAYIRDKNADVNKQLERRVELLREIAGLEPLPSPPEPGKQGDVYAGLIKQAQENSAWWEFGDWSNSRSALANGVFASLDKWASDFNGNGNSLFTDAKGNTMNLREWLWGVSERYGSDIAKFADAAAAQEMIYGDYRKNATESSRDFLYKALFGSSNANDIQSFMQNFESSYSPYGKDGKPKSGLIAPWQYGHLSKEEADAWTNEDIQKSLVGNTIVWAMLQSEVQAQQDILNFKKKLEEKKLEEADVIKALLAGDPTEASPLVGYDFNNAGGWFKGFGFNSTTKRFEGVNGGTPDESAKSAVAAILKLLEAIQRLGLAADPATQNLQATATTLYALGQKFLNPNLPFTPTFNGRSEAGGTVNVDNADWTWSSKDRMWKSNSTLLAPMTETQMQAKLSGFNKKGNNGTGDANSLGGNGTGGGGHRSGRSGGAKASDYKSHYNNGNATPKQVIVRIENLMNVKSVDLSNPDKAAVIANLKGELAQALVDVVHDFDETWHG